MGDDSYEGEATQTQTIVYLDTQDQPNVAQNILVLYSGLFYDFELPSVYQEIEIQGTLYQVTRIQAPPAVQIYTIFVKPLPDRHVDRSKQSKLDHSMWQFIDDC